MTYDIIESNPPKEENHLTPLPSRLNDSDKHPGLDLTHEGSVLKYNGPITKSDMEATSVRADFPMSPQCGVYYYEVTIDQKSSKDGMVAVGFSTQKASLERLPGWETESWAYHGDDGKVFSGESTAKSYFDGFGVKDVVGCGVNFMTGSAFFTKNGVNLGVAFRELKDLRAFPAIGLKKHAGTIVTVNFGQLPFVYDIDKYVKDQETAVEAQISTASVVHLRPPLDESNLLQALVAHYLSHDGYVETAKAFAAEAKADKRSLTSSEEPMEELEEEEDLQAINRQSMWMSLFSITQLTIIDIRTAILDGDIDRALKHTSAYFLKALNDNPQIVFRLKCRKWIELIRQANELSRPIDRISHPSANTSSAQNGSAMNDDSVFTHDMELDDWEKMEADEQDRTAQAQKLQMDAIEYGGILMKEYGSGMFQQSDKGQSQYGRMLNDIFSLIAYDDAKSSVHGHLLDPAGRVAVAEELNSAILGRWSES